MSRCRASKVILGWIFVLAATAGAQYQWTSMDGPRWVNGIDVAYGDGGRGLAWHRYLIGSNGSDIRPFYWGQGAAMWTSWSNPNPLPAANKLISYKIDGLGHIAFCSVYSDKIYETSNGGEQWLPVPNSVYIPNKHFTSIEVPNASDNAGNVVMVAAEAQQGVVSTFYTEDGGTEWQPIGANSTVGWQVNDIEAFPEHIYTPKMAIATSNGIYTKLSEGWNDPWQYGAFQGFNVPALESIDGEGTYFQMAAVEELPDNRCKLYFAGEPYPPWSNPVEIKMQESGDSFNRRVRDIAAIYWGDSCISCYVAADEGLFRVTFSGPSEAELMDVATICPAMSDDSGFTCVDYLFKSGMDVDSAMVLAGSHHSVYEVVEVRDSKNDSVISIQAKEAVRGTYYIGPDDAGTVKAGR